MADRGHASANSYPSRLVKAVRNPQEDVFVAFFDGLVVVGQVQRAFLATAGEGGGEYDESAMRDEQQALHGGVLCEIVNGPGIPTPALPMHAWRGCALVVARSACPRRRVCG